MSYPEAKKQTKKKPLNSVGCHKLNFGGFYFPKILLGPVNAKNNKQNESNYS